MGRVFLILLCLLALGASEPGPPQQGPVHIRASRLEADYGQGVILFSGNVVAVRGDFRLQSQKLKVYLLEGQQREVERIEAFGDVRILYGTRRALCDRAIYYVQEEKLVLEGAPLLWEGDNRLRGDRVVVFLKEDRAVAEASEGRQVELTIAEGGDGGKLLPRP